MWGGAFNCVDVELGLCPCSSGVALFCVGIVCASFEWLVLGGVFSGGCKLQIRLTMCKCVRELALKKYQHAHPIYWCPCPWAILTCVPFGRRDECGARRSTFYWSPILLWILVMSCFSLVSTWYVTAEVSLQRGMFNFAYGKFEGLVVLSFFKYLSWKRYLSLGFFLVDGWIRDSFHTWLIVLIFAPWRLFKVTNCLNERRLLVCKLLKLVFCSWGLSTL